MESKSPSKSHEAQSITPEQKKQILKIEKLKINFQDKLSLVLLILGKKQATDIGYGFMAYPTSDKAQIEIEKGKTALQPTIDLCNESSMVFESETVFEEIQERKFIGGFKVLIAKSVEILNEFREAEKKSDNFKIGKLYGYPETAITWFNNKSKQELMELPKIIEAERVLDKEDLRGFLEFRLSPNHWKEELEFVRGNKELVKIYSPNLYAEIVTMH
ncbi:MAG: hypothetical protein WCG28_01255 [bacterium]